MLTVSWNGVSRRFSRYGPFELEITPSKINPTFWTTAGEFLLWGMHHILIGFDHIAFLLALLLGARKMGEMVRVVTSFTVAHSLTLLLAARDLIRLPSAVTESLIAASIVYVAVGELLHQGSAPPLDPHVRVRPRPRPGILEHAPRPARRPRLDHDARGVVQPGRRAGPDRDPARGVPAAVVAPQGGPTSPPPTGASACWSGWGRRRSCCWASAGWWTGCSSWGGCRSRTASGT